jgi:glycine reductase complex component B subunit gamma
VVRGVAIPHPTGDPRIEMSGEVDIRKKLLTLALKGLESKIEEQTVYKVDP